LAPRLAPELPLAIPLSHADGTPSDGYPFVWSVYRWLTGESATAERITDMGQLAIELARFIAALQRIDPAGGPPPSEVNSFRGVPLSRRDAGTRAAIAALESELDTGVQPPAIDWGRASGSSTKPATPTRNDVPIASNQQLGARSGPRARG
jgi:aminoglycoside phosphotransferase (APT) family kinase protein